ncbi:MAG: beta-N-acetylhexosaminidase [Desulfobacterales bacterium]|nr:beta-N-acetylhexosaminidase [Desulfobacterales bacterium]MDD4391309.1 beta-N-acetylhexosaminidase [Desulfobacterales bacterium]
MDIGLFSDLQLAGQRLMVGFNGTGLNPGLKFLIDTLKVGGVILFSRNIVDPDQLRELCGSVQDYALSVGQPPLFIAIDQEGGKVARLKPPFTQFPGNPHMAGKKDARRFAEITARELAQVGINMNMAPVLDVAPLGMESIMADRAFGDDPLWVSYLGAHVIEHLQKNGVMAVAKHFPGIGRTILDSHLDRPSLAVDLNDMKSFDLVPFEDAIRHDVSAVMLSHILYDAIDDKWPASLSPAIARDLLRARMGFDALVITDDLDMGAIKGHYDIQTVMGQVMEAQIDIALICHSTENMECAVEEILHLQKASKTVKTNGWKSVRRIMALKEKYL